MATNTFTALFESQRESLKSQLEGLFIPNDAAKIQQIVGDYLSQVFDKQGEMRMALTQSEDYILQAALTLLNAQQKMATIFAEESAKSIQTMPDIERKIETSPAKPVDAVKTLSGSAIGGIGGGLLFGTWGAVFGSIAGTALVLYMNTIETKETSTNPIQESTILPLMASTPINVEVFLEIIQNICQSIDALIDTYRVQMKRIVQKYEEMEKPTLEREYRGLLEGIQSLVGYKRVHTPEEPKYIGKLQERIEDIVELLDNYNLTVENYNGDNAQHFELLTSSNTTEPKMVTPAILKNGNVVLKGKVFVTNL